MSIHRLVSVLRHDIGLVKPAFVKLFNFRCKARPTEQNLRTWLCISKMYGDFDFLTFLGWMLLKTSGPLRLCLLFTLVVVQVWEDLVVTSCLSIDLFTKYCIYCVLLIIVCWN